MSRCILIFNKMAILYSNYPEYPCVTYPFKTLFNKTTTLNSSSLATSLNTDGLGQSADEGVDPNVTFLRDEFGNILTLDGVQLWIATDLL